MFILIIAGLVTLVLTAVMSMAGLGAAFILIPIFLAFGIDLRTAMATALLLNAIGMSIASITFIRNRLVDWPLVLPMLIAAVIASPLGVLVAQVMDRAILLWLFVTFLFFAALMMLFYRPQPRPGHISWWETLVLAVQVGGAAGFVGGLLGVGGGNIIVPSLVAVGLEPKRASASASFVVIFSSLAGFMAYSQVARLDVALLIVTSLATIGGAALGSWLAAERLQADQLRLIIGLALIAVAIKTAWGLL